MKQKVIFFIIAIILTACSSNPSITSTEVPSVEPSKTTIATLPALPTNTSKPSPTVTPIPIGGGQLLVAFYASGNCGSCIIIGDFFTGEVLFKIPLSADYQTGNIFWSPDGKNILYSDPATSRMNVLLFNLETGKSKKLGDYPPKGGTPEIINSLKYVKWSYDSEYVMYDVLWEDGQLQKSYFSTKDGTSNSYESGFTNWFPDSRTMFSIYGGKDSYNVESATFAPVSTGILSKFNAVQVLQDFIILEKDKAKISAIPFPSNWNDTLAWQHDTLNSQIVTLATLSKEIKNGKIHVSIAEKVNDNKIVLIGYVTISDQISYFMKLIDLQNLPAEIQPDDIFQEWGDMPLIVSHDGKYYLKSFCTFIEKCPNYSPNYKDGIVRGWGFQVVSFDGVEQALPTNLSQFKEVTKVFIFSTSNGLPGGIAFYWK